MHFEMHSLSANERYQLMASTIAPRPIAWVTTQSASGRRNAAPFSFFNMMGAEPPLIALGFMSRPDGAAKDTAANIIETRQFVVNLVREADAEAMNFTCIDAPPEFDELAAGNIVKTPSVAVTPPRIASAPVSMECRLFQHIVTGPSSSIVLGEVLHFHIDDRFIDAASFRVDTRKMQLIGRTHGPGHYTRTQTPLSCTVQALRNGSRSDRHDRHAPSYGFLSDNPAVSG